jgi:pyruvate dehydrogenase E1 component alpha subunit
MGTAVDRASAVSEMAQKAEGYGMKNRRIDGMNVLEVRKEAGQMIEEIRKGSGPQFLEIITYRFRGHSMGDPERYRKPEEVHKYQENDPIGIYRNHLIQNGLATEAEVDEQDDLANDHILAAVEFAESSPEPAPEDLFKNVYVEV